MLCKFTSVPKIYSCIITLNNYMIHSYYTSPDCRLDSYLFNAHNISIISSTAISTKSASAAWLITATRFIFKQCGINIINERH